MTKQYIFPPANWQAVSRGMIVSDQDVTSALLRAKRWFFYDTCALMHHAHSDCSDAMIRYMKRHQGIVILLQTVVMELSSVDNGNIILPEHAQYISKMINTGIPVVFMVEEQCCKILQTLMQTGKAERNERFTYAIRHLRGGNSGLERALDALPDADKKRILSGNPVREELGDTAVKAIREGKRQGDSLGEEMIFYCLIMLAALFCPMVVFSDDKSAFDRFSRTADYIQDHYQRKEVQYYSSVHLCHMMFQQGILPEGNVEGFLKAAYGNSGEIGFRGITAQDVHAEEKKMAVKNIAKLICTDRELRILI